MYLFIYFSVCRHNFPQCVTETIKWLFFSPTGFKACGSSTAEVNRKCLHSYRFHEKRQYVEEKSLTVAFFKGKGATQFALTLGQRGAISKEPF